MRGCDEKVVADVNKRQWDFQKILRTPAEFDNLRNGAAYDHDSLLARLDDLSERLKETDPKFPSWQAAMAEVKSFVDRLEEHEAMEVMNIESCLAKTAVK